jgi:Protein of unknown function (DUF2829)
MSMSDQDNRKQSLGRRNILLASTTFAAASALDSVAPTQAQAQPVMNDIGWVVSQLKNGRRVRRSGWNGQGMHIELVEGSSDALPYVTMFTAQRMWQPGWVCSQADLLATDWELAG